MGVSGIVQICGLLNATQKTKVQVQVTFGWRCLQACMGPLCWILQQKKQQSAQL